MFIETSMLYTTFTNSKKNQNKYSMAFPWQRKMSDAAGRNDRLHEIA